MIAFLENLVPLGQRYDNFTAKLFSKTSIYLLKSRSLELLHKFCHHLQNNDFKNDFY